jgi:CRISPR system Cascade subunit CasC
MILDLHLLRNLPPSCLNRDNLNQPKTCVFGGTTRGRISSQCWKRALRKAPEMTALPHGQRTKSLAVIEAALLEQGVPAADVPPYRALVAKTLAIRERKDTKEQLVFLADGEAERMAKVLVELAKADKNFLTQALQEKDDDGAEEEGTKKKPTKAMPKLLAALSAAPLNRASVDIALFGRMTTSTLFDDAEAACQVAHPFTIHPIVNEIDFFTLVDDLQPKEEMGAGHMGRNGFHASCFYFHLVVHLEKLVENLKGNRALALATLHALLRSAVFTLPSARQNTFEAHTLPHFVLAELRDWNQPISYANAFTQGSWSDGVDRLLAHRTKLAKLYNLNNTALALNLEDIAKPEGVTLCPSFDDLLGTVMARLT